MRLIEYNSPSRATENNEGKCQHDECAECHHLISKGSGQEVVYDTTYISLYGPSCQKKIFCDLHKKPYDRVIYHSIGSGSQDEYLKSVEPWKSVNEDGSDYKEAK